LGKDISRLEPGSQKTGDQPPVESATPDWKDNFLSNIAIKITAPLLWFLVFIGTAVSFLLSGDVDTKIRTILNNHADHYAYSVSKALTLKRADLDAMGREIVSSKSDNVSFTAVRLRNGILTRDYGIVSDTDENISRDLLVPGVNSVSKGTITFYHTPVRKLVKKERVRMLVSAGVPLILIGVALSLLINRIVVGPIRDLVQATRKITAGDTTLRLNSRRQDEFGHLERFFDKMLDQLQERKDQLQTALESAQAADRIKSQFLANMSHELRTPLNAIIGYSELIMENLSGTQAHENEIRSDLERIRSAGRHLLTLINDVLDIAKIEAGKMEITRSRFRIRQMIDAVASTSMPLMIRNNNVAEIDCPDTLGDMKSDELRIQQVLINLMSNAAKFTRDGNIRLSAERYAVDDTDWLRFKVEDNGIGISDIDSKRLFNEFAQVEDHISGKPVGTGLGLAISRKFCELMGGTIRLNSTPKVGSTFIVELPAELPLAQSVY